ncbi:branched-chain amino acid aminotransferase [Niallia sp. XMNu-256]|uniref:branched-chain amino acid aminotransferase n=1 Tax=Niallia sp. XMNu-256 TaxID=3082444 RepID=UPI0030D15813
MKKDDYEMLRNKLLEYIEKQLANQGAINVDGTFQIELYKEEKDYLEKHPEILEGLDKKVLVLEKGSSRFQEVYIEMCNKETDELLAEEPSTFLDQPIQYFYEHLEEFMYLESPWFDMIGVDAISFEMDSVFKTYDVMFGLKLQKKFEPMLKAFFKMNLKGENSNFNAMFNSNEGIWDVNFSINDLEQYRADWTVQEAYHAVYRFLFALREYIEEKS